ncbi:MAG: SigB/SigF/SigG family RNA polymerase sigma factor [Clostridia bacterium]|nr:SigB/SigF/SigG family RNA polymerase sigma factor [Clostridia bacterium]
MGQKVVICGVDTSHLKKLTHKESEELLLRIKEGDREAREEFIMANVRLVLSIIKRFPSAKASADDLFQAGMIGLIKSIDNFDLGVGVRFSTYAVPMIIGEIKRVIRGRNSLRVSRSIRDTAYKVLQARTEIEAEKDDVATLGEIASRIGVAEKEVVYALDAISDTVSLYDPVYNKSGDELLLMDQIGDEKNTDEKWTENVALENAVAKLSEREKKILYLRYYEGKTQVEISEEIGLSQAQVSRLEKSALKSVKNKIN